MRLLKNVKINSMYSSTNRHFINALLGKNQKELDKFFNCLENEKDTLFFYDYTLAERNIAIPACFVFGILLRFKIGKVLYNQYIKQGAMYGILKKYGYEILQSEVDCFGAYNACLAKRKKVII